MKNLHPGRWEAGRLHKSVVVLFVWGSQGVLLPGGSGLLTNGRHGAALSLHVLIQSLSMREALGVATSTNKKKVQVLPHMAEASLGVLIDNPTVWTEGQLPAPCTNANQLPHQALMPVDVCQEELPVQAHADLWRHHGCQARWPCVHKGDRAAGRCLRRPSGVNKGTQSTAAVNLSG